MKNVVLKKGILLVVAVAIFGFANGQNTKAQDSQLYKMFQMKYVFGMKYNDSNVAKDAMYSMIAMDPNDDSLKMNLCYYYYEQNQFASSLFVAMDVLSRNPEELDALRISAVSYERMGVRDKAVDAYESVYLKTNEINVLYQVAILQYEIKRLNECKTNLDIILENPQSKALKLKFSKNETEQQDITLEAAVYNVKGMIAKEEGDKAKAKSFFEKSIEIEPEFSLALKNLKEL